jgi:hypothetical protein
LVCAEACWGAYDDSELCPSECGIWSGMEVASSQR